MIHAQIKNGIIVNIIVTKNTTILADFIEGFDDLIRIDNISPIPGVGYTYDGEVFIAPPQEENMPEPEE